VSAQRPPDVLLVVLDCVRASDFPGGLPDPPRLPFVESLQKESVRFPRAASTSPWTLPSHASIFTGLPPWKHGCHGRGSLTLPPGIRTFPEDLRERGYRTASFSANPIIGPAYGLVNGFESAYWGSWWDRAFPRRRPPSFHHAGAGPNGARPRGFRERTIRSAYSAMKRWPVTLVGASEILRRLSFPDVPGKLQPNPWIEPELRNWLALRTPSEPVFCFVNLMDAHEPYLETPSEAGSWADWWREMTIPQDSLSLLSGLTRVPAEGQARFHALYRAAIGRTDQRLKGIVSAFQDVGRWENTLFLLMGDHGQAFGERGMYWHGIRPDEAELRVPLWMRLPHGEMGGTVGRGWSSPQDTAATIGRAVGATAPSSPDSLPLQELVDAERADPLLSVTDGTSWNKPLIRMLRPDRRVVLDQVYSVAYLDRWKVVLDAATGLAAAYDLEQDPSEGHDLWGEGGNSTFVRLREAARGVASQLLTPAPHDARTVVADERLRSWGYD
jgi:arylsulfatase A-like enzyme